VKSIIFREQKFMFRNRDDAGRQLFTLLHQRLSRKPDIVLGIPRGGIPVAAVLARGFHVPLDVLVVRKLGHPGNPEFAIGAIAGDHIRVLNNSDMISPEELEEVTRRERAELCRREQRYRSHRAPLAVGGKYVLITDDGLATGATMQAAIASVRERNPTGIVVAVPVAPKEACPDLRKWADEFYCLKTPTQFSAVGEFYREFGQTSDAEVSELLQQNAETCTIH
jgi:predicted phosphoribosyltransferase